MDNGTPVARYRYKEVTLKLYVMSMHFSIFTFELSEWWSGEYTKDSQSAIFRILNYVATWKALVFHLFKVEVQLIQGE